MSLYIYQLTNWPNFTWDLEKITSKLIAVRHRQGRLLGRMEAMGADLRIEVHLYILTLDILTSGEIEGEVLSAGLVRSSIARRLEIDPHQRALVSAGQNIEGIVGMMFDVIQNYESPFTERRLFGWHAAMFPASGNRIHKIPAGSFRNNTRAHPMQIVSGPIGGEKVHFQAPDSEVLGGEMAKLFDWFNGKDGLDPVLKAAIAHLWFVTIHPFDDGNGKITRAITDMQLLRADRTLYRFYSMSAQIAIERNDYYEILEKTQKGSLDITEWLIWFLNCLDRALASAEKTPAGVLKKFLFWGRHSSASFNERQRLMLNKMLTGMDGKMTSSRWAAATQSSQDTAGRDINDLVQRGILIKESAGGRSTGYLLPAQIE